MAATERAGHVSRARLHASGSVLARRVDERRQTQQQQQQLAQQDDEEPAQVTWPELWDARTTAGFVGQQLRQQETSLASMQLAWTAQSSRQGEQVLQRKHTRLLQYSGVLARVMQRSGASRQQAAAAAGAVQQQDTCSPAPPNNPSTTQPQHLFGPPAKRRRLEQEAATLSSSGQQQHAAEAAGDGSSLHPSTPAWVCCNVMEQAGPDNQQVGVLCGTGNEASDGRCCVCGAARWDGPDGQVQQRITAALQTADLDATNLRQVTARVLAESGSRPGVVGLLPQAGMHAQVAAVVRAQLMAQQAEPAGTSNPAAAAQQQAVADSDASGWHVSVPAGQCAGRVAAPDGELQLLREAGVLRDAHGVYSSLITCMEQQQQQQQQQQLRAEQWNSEQHARLQSAAAGAAALAPGLLVSLLRQQAGVPTVRLSPKSISSWVVACFEEAAAAAVAAQAHTSLPQQEQQPQPQPQQPPLPEQPCAALRRPLPTHTLLGVCDRRGAAVRQAIADAAAAAVAACGGRLPPITRRYELDGTELLSSAVPPQEWLWGIWCADSEVTRWLSAQEGRAARSWRERRQRGDLPVQEGITSQDWDVVVSVRTRLQGLLQAWRRCLLRQRDRGGPLPDLLLAHKGAFPVREWDSQMRKLLRWQVQQVAGAWGSAPAWGLRQRLGTQQQQQEQEQQGQQEQPPASALSPRDHQSERQQQAARGPAAAAGARRASARLQAQQAQQAAEATQAGQPQQQPAAAAAGASDSGSGTESSGSEYSQSESGEVDDSEAGVDSDDTDSGGSAAAAGRSSGGGGRGERRRRRAGAARRRRHRGDSDNDQQQQAEKELEMQCAEVEAWLDSLDDLLGSGPAAEREDWRPAAAGSSLWRPVHRAGGAGGGGSSGVSAEAACGAGGLPAGVRALLEQATAAGVAPHVLARTTARVSALIGGGGAGNRER